MAQLAQLHPDPRAYVLDAAAPVVRSSITARTSRTLLAVAAAVCTAPLLLVVIGLDTAPVVTRGLAARDHLLYALLRWSVAGPFCVVGALTLIHHMLRSSPALLALGVGLLGVGLTNAVAAFAGAGIVDFAGLADDDVLSAWALSRVAVATIVLGSLLAVPVHARGFGAGRLLALVAGAVAVAAAALVVHVNAAVPMRTGSWAAGHDTAALDIVVLVLFLLAVPVAVRVHAHARTTSSCVILLSLLFQVSAQLYMLFRIGSLDEHMLGAAHGLEALACLVVLLGVTTDYLATMRAEMQHRVQLQLAVEGSSDGVWDWFDVDRDAQWWSGQFYELIEYRPQDIDSSHASFKTLLHEDDAERVCRAIQDALDQKTPFDARYRLRTKSGGYKWFHGRAKVRCDERGAPRRMAGSITDITREKSAEDALRFQKHALDEHALVAITDARGRITYANDKFCSISKYAREELIGQDHRIINSGFHGKAFFKEMYATISRGRTWRGEIRNRAKDGTAYWVDTTIVPMLDNAGKVTSYVAIRADITNRKQAEGEVLRTNDELARKNAELEQFVYTVSHDLKAPIVSLKGFAGWMQEDIAAGRTESLTRCAQRITEAAQRMECLVTDLLDLSRAARIETDLDPVELDHVVAGIIEDYRGEIDDRGIAIEIEPLPAIVCDARRIWQVFDNLVRNALKYGCGSPRPRIHIGCVQSNEHVRLFVADNGPGVPAEYRERIFRLFERLENDQDGTGVGLALVQRVVVGHAGRVWVADAPGGGAEFSLLFPRAIVSAGAPAPRADAAA